MHSPRILIISSVDPTTGGGTVAMNFYNALKREGIETDFLTKYPVKGHPEFLHVFPEKKKMSLLQRWADHRSRQVGRNVPQQGDHFFDNGPESESPVSPERILKQIKKPYDVVFIVFWHQMLTYYTIFRIWEKLRCQIHLRCPDNQATGGGCHFNGTCPRLSEGCGFCPGLKNGGPDDFTAANIRFRKEIILKMHPIIYGNTHMQNINRRSFLLRDYDRLETVYPMVDNVFFRPMDIGLARKEASVPEGKDFVLFFGSSVLDEERKGMRYLMEALRKFAEKLSIPERKRVYLLVAGTNASAIMSGSPFEYRDLGYIPFAQLPTIYNAADAFLCPSIDDAGPSMVNQSLSCGTPVVSFESGTALDMVKGHHTGYCAKLRDADDFAAGIMKIYSEGKTAFTEECRGIAIERTTGEAFVKRLLEIINKYA